MWIFLNDAMVSAVAHKTRPGFFMVRARLIGDLERVFPGCKVNRTPTADYLFRTVVSRKTLGEALVAAVSRIDYPNFKASVPFGHANRSRAYHQVWDCMLNAQLRESPETSMYGGLASPALPVDRDEEEPF